MTDIQFRRECFTGEVFYIDFELMFPGGFEFIADCHRNGEKSTDFGYSDWVRKAYENVRLLMLAGF